MLIGGKHDIKDTQNKTDTYKYIQNKRDVYKTANVQDKTLMQSLQQNLLMELSGSPQEYIYKIKFKI